MKCELTYNLAMAAGQDAGNRSMRKAGRTQWNDDDWDAAAAETQRLIRLIQTIAVPCFTHS